MRRAHTFIRDRRGAMAAEFALVLPIMLLFLFGIMDVGYYAWAINQGEKATQMGARWAVATQIIPGGQIGCANDKTTPPGLLCYSYATHGSVPQGDTVQTDFNVVCKNTGCVCKKGVCPFSLQMDAASTGAFNSIVERMNDFKATVRPDKVIVEYSSSGLGYSGDPNGPDVVPIVTVRLIDMEHRPLFGLLIGSVDLPEFAYSLTSEDGEGTISN